MLNWCWYASRISAEFVLFIIDMKEVTASLRNGIPYNLLHVDDC